MSRERIQVVLVLLTAALVRGLLISGQDLWQVEACQAWLTLGSWSDLLANLQNHGVRPPLYSALVKVWNLVSLHEIWLRLLSLLLSVGAVWWVYLGARRLFCHRTALVSALLCSTSPLLATSAGSELLVYSLDLFLAGAVLLTFLRLLERRGWQNWLLHGLALAGGLYANFLFIFLLVAEVLFIAICFRSYLSVWPRWVRAALVGLVLFAPWIPTAGQQMYRLYGHDDLITQSTGLRLSCFLTELSMGRLYAWYPLTPVISFAPAPLESEELSERRPDLTRPDSLAGGLQALQMVILGSFFMLAVVGALAAMKVSAWPMPGYIKLKLRKSLNSKLLEMAKAACPAKGQGTMKGPRQGAVLLILYFLGPLVMALACSVLGGWSFESSNLVFLCLPFLILVARGMGTLEWRVMFYAALGMIVGTGLFFAFSSKGIAGLTEGARDGARYLQDDWERDSSTAILHENPLTYYPFVFYSRGRLEGASYIAGKEVPPVLGGRFLKPGTCIDGIDGLRSFEKVWWIRIEPRTDSVYVGAESLIGASEAEGDRGETASVLEPPRDWKAGERVRFGNVTLTPYSPGEIGDGRDDK